MGTGRSSPRSQTNVKRKLRLQIGLKCHSPAGGGFERSPSVERIPGKHEGPDGVKTSAC